MKRTHEIYRASHGSRRYGHGHQYTIDHRRCDILARWVWLLRAWALVLNLRPTTGRRSDEKTKRIQGLAVMFGIRLPRALTVAFIDKAPKAKRGDRRSLCRNAGLIAARTAVMTAVAAIDADMRTDGKSLGGLPPADNNRRGRLSGVVLLLRSTIWRLFGLSAMSAASRNAAIGACECSYTRPPTSC